MGFDCIQSETLKLLNTKTYILADVRHTWRISSSVIQLPTSVLLAKTRRLAPMSRFVVVSICVALKWRIGDIGLIADQSDNWLLQVTNRQALPCSRPYGDDQWHQQPKSKHPSSRSNSSNMNAEFSGHPHPLGLSPNSVHFLRREGRIRDNAYRYWACSLVRVY